MVLAFIQPCMPAVFIPETAYGVVPRGRKRLGASAIAGIMMTVYTFSGLAVNVIMPFLRKLMRRRLLSLFMLLMVIGTALISFAQNVWMMLFGMAICGVWATREWDRW